MNSGVRLRAQRAQCQRVAARFRSSGARMQRQRNSHWHLQGTRALIRGMRACS
jgi:hypothetical protein